MLDATEVTDQGLDYMGLGIGHTDRRSEVAPDNPSTGHRSFSLVSFAGAEHETSWARTTDPIAARFRSIHRSIERKVPPCQRQPPSSLAEQGLSAHTSLSCSSGMDMRFACSTPWSIKSTRNGTQDASCEAEFIRGDVCDRDMLAKALEGVEQVVHLAAEVGVGQSMYEVSRYVQANTGGTGVLLDIIANDHTGVGRIVVASSMSIYGEGLLLV